ncbi:MAG TPA: hypothetical protein PK745_07345 [bacterium]|nr:hypothetical protein [bacterium]
MNAEEFRIFLSAPELERFGCKTARAEMVALENIDQMMEFCSGNHIEFLIARSPTTDIKAAQEMEKRGFLLMDTLLYLSFFYGSTPLPVHAGEAATRPARPDDLPDIQLIARQSFSGYYGHYHADERLDDDKCSEAYSSWITRSCRAELADEVLVAEINGKVMGFSSLKMAGPDSAEWTLGCVSPDAQGKGVFKSLTAGAILWGADNNLKKLSASTLINTIPVLKTWQQMGFTQTHSFYTFHKWFS